MDPLITRGWVWTSGEHRIPPADTTPKGWLSRPWGHSGPAGHRQPDNYEGYINGLSENCLVFLNNAYQDGIVWHDAPCTFKASFMCEVSEKLLTNVQKP